VQEFCEEAFGLVDLDWRQYVRHDARYERPSEVDLLLGNPAKAARVLGWKSQVTFRELTRMMVEADLRLARRELAMARSEETGTEV
jgi:GDPmannose 4,6-dehydratase